MSLVALIKGHRGESGFGYASTAEQLTEGIDLEGKTALITGINSGLGQETARVLALRGAHIVGLARSEEKAREACAALAAASTPVACELSDLESVKRAAETVAGLERPIDILIANAGIMALPRLETVHGIEKQFFTNHIGHFVLVTSLLDSLAEDGRVVMLSSDAHRLAPRCGIELDNLSGEHGYQAWRAYGQSKLANLLFAKELARRLEGTDRTANAVHPGVIRTNLSRHMGGVLNTLYGLTSPLYAKSVAQGAATTCYVAAHPDAAAKSGAYFADCNVAKPSRPARDPELATRLWEITEDIVESILGESSRAA